jgi:hypothetical protein
MTEVPNNPYEAPKADLNAQPAQVGQSGSLDDAIAGRYNFDIGEVMREAWGITKGMKGSFWGAALILYAIVFVVAFVGGFIFGNNVVGRVVLNIFVAAASSVLGVGIVMMGVRRAAGLPVSFSTAFGYFDRALNVFLAILLSTLLIYVGLVLLIIPGVYLAIGYCMTMPLIGDRNLRPWQAIETSRKAVSKRWFQFLGLFLVVGLLVLVSMIPLGLGLIWTAPWSINVIGVVYRRAFGVAQTA